MHSTVHQTETLLFGVLLQVVVMIAAARLGNQLLRKLGQPGVIGEIVAGLLLGPSLFGRLFPAASHFVFGTSTAAPIGVISQIGLVLLMFQIGAEFEFSHLADARSRHATLAIAVASIGVPSALGLAIGLVSARSLAPQTDRLTYALFLAVGFAITAVPILGRILREFDLTQRRIGVVAIAAAALNDVTGWVMLAAISAYASARLSLARIGLQIGGIVLLGALAWFVLRPLVRRLLEVWPIEDGEVPANLMAVVVCLIFSVGLFTSELGIFTIFGGFLAGLLFHTDRRFVAAWRSQVGNFVLVLFLPVFFTYTGLRTDLLGIRGAGDWGWLALVVVAAIAGKLAPVYLAGRAFGFSRREGAILGVLMNTRALMELIVINIGLDYGFIPRKVFTMLVIMAVATTVMTGPLLRALLPGAGYRVPQGVEA